MFGCFKTFKVFLFFFIVGFYLSYGGSQLEGWHVSRRKCSHINRINDEIVRAVETKLHGLNTTDRHMWLDRFVLRKKKVSNLRQGLAVIGLPFRFVDKFFYIRIDSIKRFISESHEEHYEVQVGFPDNANWEDPRVLAVSCEFDADKYASKFDWTTVTVKETTALNGYSPVSIPSIGSLYRVVGNILRPIRCIGKGIGKGIQFVGEEILWAFVCLILRVVLFVLEVFGKK